MLERKAPGHNLQVPGNSEEDLLFCAAGWGFACPCLIPRFACVVSVLEERWLLRAAPVPVDWKSGNSQEQNPFLSSLLTPPALPEPPKFPCLQPAQSLGKLIPLFVPWARLLLLLTFSLALPAGNTLSTTLSACCREDFQRDPGCEIPSLCTCCPAWNIHREVETKQ